MNVCRNKLKHPFKVFGLRGGDKKGDETMVAVRVWESQVPLVRKMLTLRNSNFSQWFKIKGIKVTKQNNSYWNDHFEERRDPQNQLYYWLTGKYILGHSSTRYDDVALKNNYVSITPIHYDLTNYNYLTEMDRWKVKDILKK